MVNRRVLNKMGVKYFQMVSFHIGRERQRIVFHWNRSRIMRTKCECQRTLSIITLDALLCSSASFFVFLVVRSESWSIVFSALSFPVLLSQIIRVASTHEACKMMITKDGGKDVKFSSNYCRTKVMAAKAKWYYKLYRIVELQTGG